MDTGSADGEADRVLTEYLQEEMAVQTPEAFKEREWVRKFQPEALQADNMPIAKADVILLIIFHKAKGS